MLVWQFRQPLPTVPNDEKLVVLPVGKEAFCVGCPLLAWQSWHRKGGRELSMGEIVEPCGWWQMVQFSVTGWWLKTKGPRFSMWHW